MAMLSSASLSVVRQTELSPSRRIGRGLRTFASIVREGLREAAMPAAVPPLRDYPIRRS